MSSHEERIASEAEAYFRNQARQASWVNDPVGWAKDVLGVHLWSKQTEICESLINNKRTVVASCHGTGKALGLGELVHTPSGPVPMGDITEGMKVLGVDGSPVEVVATTGHHKAESYVVRMERGGATEEIVASGDHLWPVLTVQALADIQLRSDREGVPVETGLWMHKTKILSTRDLLKMRGTAVVPGRMPEILPRGIEWNPDEQITSLLAERGGLDPQGRPSLLWKTRREEPEEIGQVRARLRELGVQTAYRRDRSYGTTLRYVAMLGSHAPTLLPNENQRSLALSHFLSSQGSWGDDGWRIVSVKPVGEQDVQCIQVDSPDHLYLCGERGIPTHNSMIASVLACWWVSTKPPGQAIVVSTAPTYAQVNKILWEEIRKHHSNASRGEYPMPGRVTQADEWKLGDGQIVGFGRKPAKGDRHSFHGIHRRYVLALLDEACGIPEEIWTGVEAITTNIGCRILAIGNPDDRNTDFGKNFLESKTAHLWTRISIPASSTPNFTGEPVPRLLNEVLVSKNWVQERKDDWGEKDPRYIAKVLAQFPTQSMSSLFPPSVVADAIDEPPTPSLYSVLRLGVDVARFGSDKTVVASYSGITAQIEESWSGTDTVSSAHKVLEIAERLKQERKAPWVEIRVDAVGLGAGVVDTLNARSALLPEQWYTVYEMHGSASPPADVGGSVYGFYNARAYWFEQLRQKMRNGSVKLIDPDELIADDLKMVFYSIKNGRLLIASKEDMRKEYGKSPDFADAIAYAVAPVAEGLQQGDVLTETAEAMAASLVDDRDFWEEESISPY
ncbi:terminase [Streptomyces phage Satis]|nr:terminase [Streptomyces phage Satis]QBZ71922.1 terminase [Streptomyces phage Kradal]QPL14340.1 terminase [Streptomyces phage EhyElimayoE]